jgi:hypothetical protein
MWDAFELAWPVASSHEQPKDYDDWNWHAHEPEQGRFTESHPNTSSCDL